ncbi:nuclear transport factor 2 family protein [Aureispira anguillae]|uniref:Nuclear transport factor 2 family protein n=1 Tax=Aureispira anguillae TaxID=2864201 RepID=A0A915YKA5_9BACT|nr:nuclear transport factor 2 family protein [Aureispira anguillae]BDS14584.1 nuclear transport factor 2 family protein [Aureispira anguillae]
MQNTITTFYEAFQNLDAEGMKACYHQDIEFWDPGFGTLKGEDAGAMWTMLCQNAQDFKLEFSNITANEQGGTAHWEAWYTFSRTGRKVHNIIDATFEFKEGKIIKHTDQFNLHKWARQALGFQGFLLGGTAFFQKKLQQQTQQMLQKFKAKNIV